jgi:hypothetical protein
VECNQDVGRRRPKQDSFGEWDEMATMNGIRADPDPMRRDEAFCGGV